MHWSHEELMELDHAERERWVAEALALALEPRR
jgi:hypothetical protein